MRTQDLQFSEIEESCSKFRSYHICSIITCKLQRSDRYKYSYECFLLLPNGHAVFLAPARLTLVINTSTKGRGTL